jgi:hypothetical protein
LKPDDELVFGVTTNVKDRWEAARRDADLEHVRFRQTIIEAATIMDEWHEEERVQSNGESSGEMVH